MDFDPTRLREDDSRDFERIADIKESAHQFISALQIERDPEIERTILSFNSGSEDDLKPVRVPDFMQRNLQADTQVGQLWIDATVNRLTGNAEIGLYATAVSAANDLIVVGVTVDGQSDQPIGTSLTVGADDMPIFEPTTTAELNQFLASLFTLSKTGDYSDFNEMNLKDIEILERLVEAIKISATQTVKHNTYILSDTLSPITDCITYVEQDGTPIQCDVTIEHRGKASTYEMDVGTTTENEDNDLYSDENPEFIMQALDGIRTYAQNIDGERTQIPSTNDGLRVLNDFLIERSASVFTKSPEEELRPEHDIDPTSTINFEDAAERTWDY